MWICPKDRMPRQSQILKLRLKMSSNPANIHLGKDVLITSWRRLQFNIFCQTSSRRVCKTSSWRLLVNTSWRRLGDPLKTSCKHVLRTSWRCLRRWQIFALKAYSRRLGKNLREKPTLSLHWNFKVKRNHSPYIMRNIFHLNYDLSSGTHPFFFKKHENTIFWERNGIKLASQNVALIARGS